MLFVVGFFVVFFKAECANITIMYLVETCMAYWWLCLNMYDKRIYLLIYYDILLPVLILCEEKISSNDFCQEGLRLALKIMLFNQINVSIKL
jgi:hypothetical protein